jgi:type II secretory pathway component HofQ
MQLSAIPAPAGKTPSGQSLGEKRITMSATNADVRALLVGIASAGDVNLVLSPDVQGKVSVAFKDVPVSEAIRRVLTEAGLGVVAPKGMVLPWDPTLVFYQLPLNVDRLSEEAIMARYGVSRGIAEVIVRERKP